MNTKNVGVSVVIPNYNGLKLLKKHLPSVIRASKNRKNKIKEIIVIDDASTDESVKIIQQNFKEIKLIKHRVNRGFSSTVNTGVRTAKGELVCLLNTDVGVSENFLEEIIDHFSNDKVFAVSLHEKGFGGAKGMFENGFVNHKGTKETKKAQRSFWVSGGSGVYRRDVWHQLKGMDEELMNPFYWEDIDICYRAQKRGYYCVWEPKSRVVHKHESTIPNYSKQKKRQRIQERNQLLFIWKNITSPNLFRKHISGLFIRMMKHPGYVIIFFLSLKKLKTVYTKRKIEKKESTVSDESIFQGFN